MLPTEQARFFEIVQSALNAYSRFPDAREIEAWWGECRGLTLEGLQAGLKAHKDDPDRGEKPPRPVDITRRLKTGQRDAQLCAAADVSGQCRYPGLFSDGTGGEGPWYCPWHRLDRAGPEASRWIEISRDTPYETARAKRIERMAVEAAHAPGVTDTAHAIALRHGNRAWQGSRLTLPAAMRDRLEDAA